MILNLNKMLSDIDQFDKELGSIPLIYFNTCSGDGIYTLILPPTLTTEQRYRLHKYARKGKIQLISYGDSPNRCLHVALTKKFYNELRTDYIDSKIAITSLIVISICLFISFIIVNTYNT